MRWLVAGVVLGLGLLWVRVPGGLNGTLQHSVALQHSGPDELTVVQLDLVRATTRPLPTTVYLPATQAPAPLIVLAHGAAGSPEKFTELATYWAEHGYVVAVPRFPLTNDRVAQPVLGDFGEQGRDVRFVIGEVLADGELADRVDGERIGLYGLSLGSLTVWSEVFDDPAEPPIDGLIQSDGTTLVTDERIAAIPFPVLVAHSDVDPVFAYAEVLARYDLLPEPKYLLTMHGAGHATVGENTDTPADEAYQQVTTAFWDRTLGGRPDAPFPTPITGVTSFIEGARPAILPPTR